MNAPSPCPPVALGTAGRFLVPHDEAAIGYYARRLRVAHGPRERLLGWLAARTRARLAGRFLLSGRCAFHPTRFALLPEAAEGEEGGTAPLPPDDLLRGLAGLPPSIREVAGLAGCWRPLFLIDYTGSARGQLLVFPFAPDGAAPGAVVKVRPLSDEPPPLRGEYDALVRLREALPAALAATLPEPLAHHAGPEVEVLVLRHLDGPSAYVQQQTFLRPARAVAGHFHAAADWLASFHSATRCAGRRFVPGPREEALASLAGEDGAAWYDELRGLAARYPLPLSAGHGDFWSRNLLLTPDGARAAGVVDWEHARPEAQPLDDLLFFPLAYGQNHPWSRYRRLPLPEALRRTFLTDGPVAYATRAYLARYARGAALALPPLRPFLRLLLLRQAARVDGEERAAWLSCDRLLAAAPTEPLSASGLRP